MEKRGFLFWPEPGIAGAARESAGFSAGAAAPAAEAGAIPKMTAFPTFTVAKPGGFCYNITRNPAVPPYDWNSCFHGGAVL